MSRSIGGIDVDLIWGIVQTPRGTITLWEVDGLDGFGAIQNGSRAPETPLRTVLYAADNSSADAHAVAANALQGTSITIVDAFGGTFTNVIVIDVDSTDFKKAVIKDGAAGFRCQLLWRVRSQ